jgi:hypothetical protein
LTYYSNLVEQQRAEAVLPGAQPLPPREQLRLEQSRGGSDDDGDDLIKFYRSLAERDSSLCGHCHKSIPFGAQYTTINGWGLHKHCEMERRGAGYW